MQLPGTGLTRPLLILALLTATVPVTYALTVPELMEFLEAEVPDELILRLLESSGTPADLSPSDIVALWDAGASDRLLEALVPVPPAPQAESSAAPKATEPSSTEIRAFYRKQPGGTETFVLTNLDDDGQRLDGRPSSGSQRNVIHSRPYEPLPEPSPAPPPEPLPVQPARAAEPVYYPTSGPTTFVQTSPYLGFFYPQPMSHLYPPGSYTHFKLYHQGGKRPGFGHYQMPAGQVFYQPPFPTAGSHQAPRRR
jgi:hypothetical protein